MNQIRNDYEAKEHIEKYREDYKDFYLRWFGDKCQLEKKVVEFKHELVPVNSDN